MANELSGVSDRVREATDIVDLIGRYVTLKKAGKDFKALCPFHKEKTPSFYVIPDKQIFHCFGCGASGDVFTFLMKYENITFMEALKRLAAEAGIELPTTPAARKQMSQNERLYRANELALKFYQMQLKKAPREVTDYLKERGISPQTMERFKLGWAPDMWDGLVKYIEKFNYPTEDFLKAGLLQKSERSTHVYDRFRARLMFPIFNTSEKVIAFGGRILSETPEAPKYLNSPESSIYQKKTILFGLPQARQAIRAQGFVLVVEGYMDVLQLAQAGFANVVATSGTALTEEHAHLIRRYTRRCILCYDADTAGIKAAMRGGQLLFNEGLDTEVVLLPPGEDPDSIIRKHGKAAFEKHLQQRQPFFDFLLQTLETQYNLELVSQRTEAIDAALNALAYVKDPFLSGFYVEKISSRWRVETPLLLNALKQKKRQLRKQQMQTSAAQNAPTAENRTSSAGKATPTTVLFTGAWRAERDALVLLINHFDEFSPLLHDMLTAEEFQNPEFQQIYQLLMQQTPPLPSNFHQQILELLEDEAVRNIFTEGLLQEFTNPYQHFVDCVFHIKKTALESQLKRARERLPALEPGSAEFHETMAEIQTILQALKTLKNRMLHKRHD